MTPVPQGAQHNSSPAAAPKASASVYRPPQSRTSISPTLSPTQPSTPVKLKRTAPAVFAYGDSFVGPLELLGERVIINKYSGASAKGLNNLASVSQTGQQLLYNLDRFRPSKILLVFGHVDLQVVYLWKAAESQRLNTPPPDPDTWTSTVFDAYTAYILDSLLPHFVTAESSPSPDRFVTHFYISSVTMPVVPDDALDRCSEKYNSASAEEWQKLGIKLQDCAAPTDLETRRRMVTTFNSRLETFCLEHDLRYLDLNQYITSPDTGVVLPPYLVPDPSTIHVVWETTIEFWVKELADTGLTMDDISQDLMATQRQYEEDKRGRMGNRSPTPRRHSRYVSTPPSPLKLSLPLPLSLPPSPNPTAKPNVYRPPHSPLRSHPNSPTLSGSVYRPPSSPLRAGSPVSPAFGERRASVAGHRRQSSLGGPGLDSPSNLSRSPWNASNPAASVAESPSNLVKSPWSASPSSNVAPLWRQRP